MGNYTSKLFYNHDIKIKSQSESLISSEKPYNCTPTTFKRKCQIDPRSVTDGILRTPIRIDYITEEPNRNDNIASKYFQSDEQSDLETTLNINIRYINELTPKTFNETKRRNSILIQNMLESNMANINIWNKSNTEELHLKQSIVNNLDPRSPANDFERTPILKVRTVEQLISSSQENLFKMKENNPNLDISIKLSYYKTAIPFKISEIQVLPDIHVSLKKSGSLQEKLNCSSITSTNDDCSKKSNLIPINNMTLNLPEVNNSLTFKPTVKINDIWKNIETITNNKEYSPIDHISSDCHVFKNIYKTMDYVNESSDLEENFIVWKDSYFPTIPSNVSIIKSNYFQGNSKITFEKEDILIELDDSIVENYKQKNFNKKKGKMVRFNKEVKSEKLDNKKQNTRNEKIVQDKLCKYTTEISRNRMPLSNRSNNNEKNQIRMNSPQHILRNKCNAIKDFQENAPLSNINYSIKNISPNFNGV